MIGQIAFTFVTLNDETDMAEKRPKFALNKMSGFK